MTNAEFGEFGERPLTDAATVALTQTVGEALERAGGGWIVITDEAGAPLAAAAPGAFDGRAGGTPLAVAVHDLAPAVVVTAQTRVRDLLHSWVVDEIEPESGVVVVTSGQILGVWARPDMRTSMALARPRDVTTDHELPGEIRIPLLTRACRYVQDAVNCPSVQLFAEPPAAPAPCANPAALTPHNFGW